MTRPAIPMEIQRAVLIEAGHQCAIPACRHPRVEIHHIIPWAKCKKHEYHNLIALCPNCHTRVHDGEIDRKSLVKYKSALVSAIRDLGASAFSHPIVEIKRRIYTIDTSHSGIYFDFEYPDFCNTDVIIASKNIEAWGNELLESHTSTAESNKKDAVDYEGGCLGTYLIGRYEVNRRDAYVLSVRYTIQGYLGGAHGYRETRAQNFLLSPFSPLTLDYLLINEGCLIKLSSLIRDRFAKDLPEFDGEWLMSGTNVDSIVSTPFIIGRYGISFIFAEYQVAGYALGSPEIHLSFYELNGIAKPEILKLLDED
ncbi:HNH endonuclease [Pseudomonas gozinkensis]|uniref:HNH endonuclease n=1 Tax=Pseudomonas gozinkensis TaxID=2774461 RepID=UPI001787DF60|nr:HNH endonuclease [Pseudomonas gozinkensis]